MLKNDLIWMDVIALDDKIKTKLHLTDNEIALTQEDMELINSSDYVDMNELKKLLDKVDFTNFEIPNELGISKAMFSMVFSDNSKNKRGLRMRTVVAILNAIRNRNIKDPFNTILVKGGKGLNKGV